MGIGKEREGGKINNSKDEKRKKKEWLERNQMTFPAISLMTLAIQTALHPFFILFILIPENPNRTTRLARSSSPTPNNVHQYTIKTFTGLSPKKKDLIIALDIQSHTHTHIHTHTHFFTSRIFIAKAMPLLSKAKGSPPFRTRQKHRQLNPHERVVPPLWDPNF
jgi:hypothetical protein